MIDLVKLAMSLGAEIHSNISGGKDGQAMTKQVSQMFPITSLIHADLGEMEWEQSGGQCVKQSRELNIPLSVVTRTDKRDLLDHWVSRMKKLIGENTPFWSSSQSRYCTSDLKRDPIDMYLRSCGDFVISCEGIRAAESASRAKKSPFQIRTRITSKYYKGMTAEEAIMNYKPGKRLAITWYPIFNYSTEDVWATYDMTQADLDRFRIQYQQTKIVDPAWPFHPAYVFGNQRVSCCFCVLGCESDLKVAAEHRPELLHKLIAMEDESGFTFKNGWSLKSLLKP